MKTINKIIFFFFSCLAFVNITQGFSYPDGRPSYALTGAMIGGATGGGKGLGYGLLAGATLDAATAPAYNTRRNDNYDNRRYSRNRRRSKPTYQDLLDENEELNGHIDELQDEIRVLQRQLRRCKN
jgi:hypothetical protein